MANHVTNPLARPEDLARFVPSFIRQRLSADPSAHVAANSESSQVAVFFADISGFTAFSERLATRGPDGVEELTQVLNAYFGNLIDLIHAHGGDVVKFAGDALLAFWPATDETALTSASQIAAQCGLQVQSANESFGARLGHRLYLRVGIGAGNVFLVSVGGVLNRWECVLVGPPVIEATQAAAKGPPGAVVLGANAWNLLKVKCHADEIAPDAARLRNFTDVPTPIPLPEWPVSAESVPHLLSYIPAAIHKRLAARQSAWLAEMRRLTVVFLNLPELNHSTPLEKSQVVMQALQTELYYFEGSVNKLSVDEKGVTLVAAMGLPPLAHEDDPVRGTLAALAMKARLDGLGWRCSVGVTTGRVFCGTVGGDKRCEYTIIGHVVNLAARLMQAAKGSILCDELTYRSAQSKVDWDVLTPVLVKGKTEPIPVFRPIRPAHASASAPTNLDMVGRDAEKRRLEQLLVELTRDRTAAVVLIEGDAGVGKSVLVSSLLRRAAELSLSTWLGAALAMERSTPYFAWRPIFRRLFRLDSHPGPIEEQRREVLRQLAFDPDFADRAPLLDVVLSLDFPPTSTTAQLFGENRLSNTNALLLDLLKRQTTQAPLQLILEDCHWLDSASWALARQVAQKVPALLLVLVTRPLTEPLPRDFIPLAAAAQRVPLAPFSPDECLTLLKRRLNIGDLPAEVAAILHTKSQGNPFFIEELAYALRDSGKIRIRDHVCTIAPGLDLSALPFPDNVQGVVTSRIDQLAPPEQLTLKVASVIGRTFSQNLLCDVCPIEDDKPNLDRHLDTLIRQSLTIQETPAPDPGFRFKHVITQEVAYQMMAPAQRKSLHQSVAEWYESHYRADLSPFFPLLAKHWCNTDENAKALAYLQKSGENAMRDFAHQEAVTFFSQALTLDEQTGFQCDPFRRACWQRQLGEAHYNLSDLNKAKVNFEVALELLGYPAPKTPWAYAIAGVWEFSRQFVHRGLPRRFLGGAAHQSAARLEAARAYERLVEIHYQNNAKIPTVHAAFRGLNLAETVGECPELARGYAHAAVFCGLFGMHGVARAHTQRARAMAQAVSQPSCSAYVEFICGVYFLTVGEWEASEEGLTNAIAITEVTGEQRRWYESSMMLVNLLTRKGEYLRSTALAREAHQLATRQGIPQLELWGLTWHLVCLLAVEPENAVILPIEKALAHCLETHPDLLDGDQIFGYGLLARSRWRRGEKGEARQAAEAAHAIMTRSNQVAIYLLPAYVSLAAVYLGLWSDHSGDDRLVGEVQRRMKTLGDGLKQFQKMYPIAEADRLLVRGRYEALLGNPDAAVRTWKQSLSVAEQARMPYEQGQAHAALALHLPTQDPEKEPHRQRAHALFTQIGAGYELRLLEREVPD